MKDNKRDAIIIEKILGYCEEISKTHTAFENNRELFFNQRIGFIYRNSITMPILQIGELVKNLSEDFTSKHKDIPWKSIAGMRDVFAHHYGSIDYEMTWDTSKKDIASLQKYLKNVSVSSADNEIKSEVKRKGR